MNVDRDRICEGGFTIDRTNFKSHGRRTVTLRIVRIVLNEDGIMTPNELCPADPHYPACERLWKYRWKSPLIYSISEFNEYRRPSSLRLRSVLRPIDVTSTNVMARNGRRIELKNQRGRAEKRRSGDGGSNVNLSFGAANRRQKTPRRTRMAPATPVRVRADGKWDALWACRKIRKFADEPLMNP